jgi:hypothetical protein
MLHSKPSYQRVLLNFIVFFALSAVLTGIFAFTVRAASKTGQTDPSMMERKIMVPNSSVQVLLKGNSSYRLCLDGKIFSRELSQRHAIRLRHFHFDPLLYLPMVQESPVKQANASNGAGAFCQRNAPAFYALPDILLLSFFFCLLFGLFRVVQDVGYTSLTAFFPVMQAI